ncbi:unnamed protein product [Musa banksii]
MAFPYLEAVLGFMIFMYFFETYLDIRQHAALKLTNLPKPLEGVISQEKFERARAYSIDKSGFHFIHEAVTILMDTAILYFGILPWFWKVSGNLVAYLGLDAENEIMHTLSFLAGVMIWSQITDLPFSLYSTFVIEARHGFNKQTVWLFFRDMFKGICLSILLGPPIVAAIIFIVQKGGPYLAIYLWAFMFALSLVMMTLYPILIAPLFNKFTPLPDGELREKIEKLAASLKFPLKKLFVVDGSTRSSHSNAYMYGFFNNKRIVLYDTLIQQCTNEEEVVAVIAHELGHWKLNHTMYSFIAVQILTFLQFGGYTLVRNSKDLFESFGFDTQPILIGLIIFQHTVIPLQHLVNFGLNLVSRTFEFQADAFAKKLGYAKALRAGLIKLQEENLSAMNTDPWYSAYHYSHPPLVERLTAIEEPDNKTEISSVRVPRRRPPRGLRDIRCEGRSPSDGGSRSENAVLRLAWYGSELLGIAASLFRPSPSTAPSEELRADGLGFAAGRAEVAEAIKEDFDRSYFVTGNLTLEAYEDDCEFADPAGSFRGLQRFKRNCTNFGSLLEKSSMKLTKWEDFEDKSIGHWRFSCIMSFPWRPILSATGYTEYYFDAQSGRVCRHVEHWNVPKMALFKQIFRPSRWVWEKR